MYRIRVMTLIALTMLVGGSFMNAEAQKRRMPPVSIPPVLSPLSGIYTVAVDANELSTGDVEPTTGATYGWTSYGATGGDLAGFIFISANYAPSFSSPVEEYIGNGAKTITGGSWSKLIFIQGVYAGSVYGKIVSGEVVSNGKGLASTVTLQLTADDGTGLYVGSAGSATFDGVLDSSAKRPTLSGQLILNY